MPSSSTRRSPRRAAPPPAPALRERPLVVPFAAVFGLLTAAEDGYLAWLLGDPKIGWDWFLVVPVLLAVTAVAGAVLVHLGRRGGPLLLAVAAALTLLGLVVLAFLFGALGGGRAMWSALLLMVGPLVCLVLALRRPVRQWCGRATAGRSPGGRRGTRPSG
ncbi:MAG: hypothetical protein JF630_15410 [Geodermatophilales bacterium]|nr:hypothetical protein [Geodermatophilales bacterium]